MSSGSTNFKTAAVTSLIAVGVAVVGFYLYKRLSGHSHGHGHSHGDGGHAHAHGGGHSHSHGGGGHGHSHGGDDVAAREASGDERFSALSSSYDSKPEVIKFTAAVVEGLKTRLPIAVDSKSTDAMEFACGTGSMTIALAPRVRSVLAIDAAEGMIAQLKSKIAKRESDGSANGKDLSAKITTLCKRVECLSDLPAGRRAESVDLIWSSMAFHHLADPKFYLKLFYDMLRPGGCIAIFDLVQSEAVNQSMKAAAASIGDSKSGGGHGHSHGHSHGGGDGGHGHSHGGGHSHGAHSHGGGDAPTDVFVLGFKPSEFAGLCRGAGFVVAASSITDPFTSIVLHGNAVDIFMITAIKPKGK